MRADIVLCYAYPLLIWLLADHSILLPEDCIWKRHFFSPDLKVATFVEKSRNVHSESSRFSLFVWVE